MWYVALALVVVAGAAALFIYRSGVGKEAHLDPATAIPPSTPNWAMALPVGAEIGQLRTQDAPLWAATPLELIEAFETIALAQPRVERLDDEFGDPLWRSYVQRSKLIGYPDYISVRAVEIGSPEGARASLMIYSRSVYGHSDMGVNGERVSEWLGALEQTLPAAAR